MSSSSCETSGDESDKFSEVVGRSYDCTFCKRGFTNAQALGGHMNIHRKDKLKAKQAFKEQQHSALSRKSNSNNTHNDHQVCTQQISSSQHQQQQQNPSSRVYHQFYFPSSNPSYHFQVVGHQGYYRDFALHGDANLSLRIGSPDDDDEERKEDYHMEVSEVDLELRLGPNSTFT